MHAAGCDDRNPDRLRQLHRCFHVDAAHHAVAADIGIDDGFCTIPFELFGQIDHFMTGQLAPAVGGDLAILGVEADDDLAREGAAGVMQEARVLHRGGADDDVAQTAVQIAFYRVQVANAAAQLDRNFLDIVLDRELAHHLQDRFHRGFILWLAGESAVQVHQMQAARALQQPVARHGGRVFGKYGGLVHVALFQAYAVTVFKIDCRDEQHGELWKS